MVGVGGSKPPEPTILTFYAAFAVRGWALIVTQECDIAPLHGIVCAAPCGGEEE